MAGSTPPPPGPRPYWLPGWGPSRRPQAIGRWGPPGGRWGRGGLRSRLLLPARLQSADFEVRARGRRVAPGRTGLPRVNHEEPQVPPEEAGRARLGVVQRRRRRQRGESRGPCAFRAPCAPLPRSPLLLGSARPFLGFPSAPPALSAPATPPSGGRSALARRPWGPSSPLSPSLSGPFPGPSRPGLLAPTASESDRRLLLLNPVFLGCLQAPALPRRTPGLALLPTLALFPPGSAGPRRAPFGPRGCGPGRGFAPRRHPGGQDSGPGATRRGLRTSCESETRSAGRYGAGWTPCVGRCLPVTRKV